MYAVRVNVFAFHSKIRKMTGLKCSVIAHGVTRNL